MIKRIATINILACVLVLFPARGVPAQTPPQKGGPEFVPGELLVKFDDSVSLSARQSALQGAGAATLAVSPFSGVMRVRVMPGREVATMVSLAARPGVRYAEPNYIVSAAVAPNDLSYPFQWSLNNTGQTNGTPDADIDAPEAWAIETGSRSVVIAIVDSGVDLTHEDLVNQIWLNVDEIPGNSIDDDGNGFVDDVNGWDFCNSPSDSNAVRCASAEDADPSDIVGHGTQVAGVAGASGNNSIGIAGVSWNSILMSVKSLDQFGKGTSSTLADGIDYAVANGAHIINISAAIAGSAYPCSAYTTLNDAVKRAEAANVLVVASSGNYSNPTITCPAALDEVLAVGATTKFDARWSGSNYGPHLNVVAPGEFIYTTKMGGWYGSFGVTGTSFSSPHAAGLAALMKSYNPALQPYDLRTTMQSTADDLAPVGFDNQTGHGRINARAALDALVSLRSPVASTGFLVADNFPFTLPMTTSVPLLAANPAAVTFTTEISPAVSWLNVNSTGGPSPQVTLVGSMPPPGTHGIYSTTVILTAQTLSGDPLGTRGIDVYFRYLAQAKLFYLPLVVKH